MAVSELDLERAVLDSQFADLEGARLRLDRLGRLGFSEGVVPLGTFEAEGRVYDVVIGCFRYPGRYVYDLEQPRVAKRIKNRVVAVGEHRRDELRATGYYPIPYRADLGLLPRGVAKALVAHVVSLPRPV